MEVDSLYLFLVAGQLLLRFARRNHRPRKRGIGMGLRLMQSGRLFALRLVRPLSESSEKGTYGYVPLAEGSGVGGA